MFTLRSYAVSCAIHRSAWLSMNTLPFPATAISNHVRTATKKAGGSTKNGRDSSGRRLGIKVWPGTAVNAGSIIVRQRGQIFRAGDNAGMGKDHTIFAKQPGVVKFTVLPKNRKRHTVHILQNS